jgi:hypothetical protein
MCNLCSITTNQAAIIALFRVVNRYIGNLPLSFCAQAQLADGLDHERGNTKVRGGFCVRRCDPSRRGERNASAILKTFVRQPEKTFSAELRDRYRGSLGCRPKNFAVEF